MATQTPAQRQKAFRQKMADKGLVPVTGYVPAHLAGEMMAIMKQLADNPHLEPALLRDTISGRLVRVR